VGKRVESEDGASGFFGDGVTTSSNL